MLFRAQHLLAGFFLAASLAACDGGNTQDERFGVDSVDGNDPSFTAGARSAMLQVSKASGSVMDHPVLHLVTFNNDADAAALADFAQKLTTSSYWSATTQEYGVGALTAAAPQALMATWGTTATDGDLNSGEASTLEQYLVSQLDVPSPPWGAPDTHAIYALMMPSGVAVSPDDGTIPSACNANILSWHTAMLLPTSQVAVSYVVVPYCGARGAVAELDERTVALSHALVSAATDPLLNAYNTFDMAHLSWQVAMGSPEVGAACAAALGAAQLIAKPADLGYSVQRTWSNAAAAAGHMPCVPAAASEAYFASVPQISGSVQMAMSSNPSVPTESDAGITGAAGSSQDVTLQLSSTRRTSGPWTVSASEMGSSMLQFSFDKTSGNNGDQIKLTVKVSGSNATSSQEMVRVTSTLGSEVSYEYFVVHN